MTTLLVAAAAYVVLAGLTWALLHRDYEHHRHSNRRGYQEMEAEGFDVERLLLTVAAVWPVGVVALLAIQIDRLIRRLRRAS